MPSIELYDRNPLPDASHRVRAPGGYEWWYFDAEDRATDTQIVAIFLHGFVFHPGYLRAHAKFLRNPTTREPVLPDAYPCVYLCVYRGGKILHQFMSQYAAREYRADAERVSVAIGANQLLKSEDSLALSLKGRPWQLTWQGPKTHAGQSLTADLTFKPTHTHPPVERMFLSREMTGADHHWVIAHPRCDVSGTIQLSTSGAQTDEIQFNGVGYHDHNYGTGPLGPGLKRWIWGRAIIDDEVMTFHYAIPKNRRLEPEVHLIHAKADGVTALAVQQAVCDWIGWSKVGLRYPKNLAFDASLVLSNPRVIDAAPFYLRLMYDATMNGKSTTAFCEVAYPSRLRWPILGRMIEMSIDKAPPR